MFGIGTSEILVILAIALIVLGPKEIPKVAKTIGRIMREVQRATDELRRTIDAEIEEENMKPRRKIRGEKEEEGTAESEDGQPLSISTQNDEETSPQNKS